MKKYSPPRISIITATFNAANHIPYTLRSIREQTYKDFEWIIIDGNSTDGTQDILLEVNEPFIHLISEPDRGIYDAWNKGCSTANGTWLIFLGAGDELAQPEAIELMVKHLELYDQGTPIVYGWLTLLSPSNRIPLEKIGVPWDEIKKNWEIGRPALPPHGSTFHHITLFRDQEPFDLRFPIASDAHFLLRTIKKTPPKFLPIEVTKSTIGGVSFQLETAMKVSREISEINLDLGINPPMKAKIVELIRIWVISVLILLPRNVSRPLADLIRLIQGKNPRWNID